MGRWAQRKKISALDRQASATIELEESSVPPAKLEREWEAQVKAQLASAPRK